VRAGDLVRFKMRWDTTTSKRHPDPVEEWKLGICIKIDKTQKMVDILYNGNRARTPSALVQLAIRSNAR